MAQVQPEVTSFGQYQQQSQLQKELQKLTQSLPRTSQGLLRLPRTSIPSVEDISTLDTILAGYKDEIQSLQDQISKLESPSDSLTSQLNLLIDRVSTLQDSINELKSIRAAYDEHKQTLSDAVATYNEALLKEQDIAQKYNILVSSNQTNQEAASAARVALTEAQTALTNAQTDVSNAQTAFDLATVLKDKLQTDATTSQGDLDTALNEYKTASDTFSQRSSELDSVRSSYNALLAELTQGNTSAGEALQLLTNKRNEFNAAQTAYDAASTTLDTKAASLTEARRVLDAANTGLDQALANLSSTSATLDAANQELAASETDLFSTQQSFNEAQQNVTTASTNLQEATQNKATTAADLSSALLTKNEAEQGLINAAQTLNQAQTAYNTELIADPSWIHPTYQQEHTRQVATTSLIPHTTTTVIPGGLVATTYNRSNYGSRPPLPTANETPLTTLNVPNINYQWGGGQVLNSGMSDRVLVKFTGYISPETTGSYRFYAPGDDGVQVYINNQLIINDWFDKGGGGSVSQPLQLTAGTPVPFTLYFYENGGGANVWLYSYTDQSGYQIVPASWFGQQTIVTTTYEEVTTYTTETYYTTELVPDVYAPLINDPAKLEALQAAQAAYDQQYASYQEALANYNSALQADNLATDTLSAAQESYNLATQQEQTTYSQLLTAQQRYDDATSALSTATADVQNAVLGVLDPTRLQSQNQQAYDQAVIDYSLSLADYQTKLSILQGASDILSASQTSYDELVQSLIGPSDLLTQKRSELEAAQTLYEVSSLAVSSAFGNLSSAEASNQRVQSDLLDSTNLVKTTSGDLATASAQLLTKQKEKDDAAAVLAVAEDKALTSQQDAQDVQAQLQVAQASVSRALLAKTTAEDIVSTTETNLVAKTKATASVKNQIEQDVLPSIKTSVETEKNNQSNQPSDTGSKEIPAVLNADNLMDVDLSKVDPTELTTEQAQQLVDAALETFKTAQEGSPEYQQALDALYLAAEQDDIQVDPAIAAIPVLGAAVQGLTDAINFLGNAGADMSPQVREKSKKIVVAAVVAAGVAVQSVASASAAAASGGSSSSGRRKVGK